LEVTKVQTLSVLLQADNPSHIDAFRAIVERLRQKVQTHPVTIEVSLSQHGQFAIFTFASWSVEEYTLETIDIVRAFVALASVEWVIHVIEPEMVTGCMREAAADTTGDWEQMKPYVLRVLEEPVSEETPIGKSTMRKARLYRAFFAYLLDHSELHLHGFVRFRLKEYRLELMETIDAAIDEYLEDKQYQEFIELLRYFISTQESRHEVIHIVSGTNKHVSLYDENGLPLQLEQLESIYGLSDPCDRSDDDLISALITLAPKKIVFHHADERQALAQTLQSIFESRFSYCSTCAYCLISGRALDLQQPTQL
jgi:putative sporulation protein YtxC